MALFDDDGALVAANTVFDELIQGASVGTPVSGLVSLAGGSNGNPGALLETAKGAGREGIPVEPIERGRGAHEYAWRLTICDGVTCLAGTNLTTFKQTSDLRMSAERLAAILHETVDAIITIDRSGRIQSYNDAAERIFGYRRREVIGENVNMLMPSPFREEHDDYIQNYLKTREPRIIGTGREVVGRRKDGSLFPMDLAVSEVAVDGVTTFTGIIRDITQRRELENEILNIGDEERRRIGQDLHDELGQMLTGIGLMTQNVSRRLAVRNEPEAEELEQITRFIREADEYARTLARGLVPVEFDGHGLPAALTRLASNASTLFGIKCSFTNSGGSQYIAPTHSIHLYRIAQEALSNAARHGKATQVRLDLAQGEERIRLRIEDNGTGFEPEWSSKGGTGVRIMRYRANIVGGTLDISESLTGGTVVSCTVHRRLT